VKWTSNLRKRTDKKKKGVLNRLLRCSALLVLIASSSPLLAAGQYDVVPTPHWVEPIAPRNNNSLHEASGGSEYQIVDRQVRLDRAEYAYTRFVIRLANVSGVEDQSQIEVEFDPKREKLHIHAVQIHRGNQIIDEMKLGQVRILQQEGELKDDVLSGGLTFHLLLSDVRVGDIIDYSYTVERRDAEWGDRHYGRYVAQWGAPVDFERMRISSPAAGSVAITGPATGKQRTGSDGGWNWWEWSQADVPGLKTEKNTPSWVEQDLAIQYSQFKDWGDVAAAAAPLYVFPERDLATAAAQAKLLTHNLATPEERIVAIVQFVQEEVRYTGIEEGEAAFRPTSPAIVLRRRYGDCKDKALLTVTMLRSVGIDAAPAIVSTVWTKEIAHRMASPAATDHVVARVRQSGKTYWFDATSTGQAGRLEYFSQAHFGWALVALPEVRGLEAMPEPDPVVPLVISNTEVSLKTESGSETPFLVSTRYLGSEADRMRRKFRTESPRDTADKYLRYYKKSYPGIHSAAPMVIRDDTERNEVKIDETYLIRDAFRKSKDGASVHFGLDADIVADSLDVSTDTERKEPLSIDFPDSTLQTLHVHLPSEWNVTQESQKVDSKEFHYHSKVSYENKELLLQYTYRALNDNVEPGRLAAYRRDLKRARDDTYFDLTYQPTSVARFDRNPSAWAPAKSVAFFILLWVLVRVFPYLHAIHAWLVTLRRSGRARPCPESEISADELGLLQSSDQELAALGFDAIGFLEYQAMDVRLDRPAQVRWYVHEHLPMAASVTRSRFPECGALKQISIVTELIDGALLVTTQSRTESVFYMEGVLLESHPASTLEQIVSQHKTRLENVSAGQIHVASGTIQDFVEWTNTRLAVLREKSQKVGWIQPTHDGAVDRFTLWGAIRNSVVTVRSARAILRAPKSKTACSPDELQARAAADHVVLSQVARIPCTGGATTSLAAYFCLLLAAGCAASLYFWGGTFTLYTLAAIAINQLARMMVIRLAGPRTASFWTFRRLVQGDLGPELSRQCAALLGGPLVGLLVGLGLLACNELWPLQSLKEAGRVLAFWNGLVLLPYPAFNGWRLLQLATRPEESTRYWLGVAAAVVLLYVGIATKNPTLDVFGIALAFLMATQFRSIRLQRLASAQVPAGSDWDAAAGAALTAMANSLYWRWSGPVRRSQAAAIANQLTTPGSSARERSLILTAYAACAGLATALAFVSH
jgi:transglutaminase-like putative cysteine protease